MNDSIKWFLILIIIVLFSYLLFYFTRQSSLEFFKNKKGGRKGGSSMDDNMSYLAVMPDVKNKGGRKVKRAGSMTSSEGSTLSKKERKAARRAAKLGGGKKGGRKREGSITSSEGSTLSKKERKAARRAAKLGGGKKGRKGKRGGSITSSDSDGSTMSKKQMKNYLRQNIPGYDSMTKKQRKQAKRQFLAGGGNIGPISTIMPISPVLNTYPEDTYFDTDAQAVTPGPLFTAQANSSITGNYGQELYTPKLTMKYNGTMSSGPPELCFQVDPKDPSKEVCFDHEDFLKFNQLSDSVDYSFGNMEQLATAIDSLEGVVAANQDQMNKLKKQFKNLKKSSKGSGKGSSKGSGKGSRKGGKKGKSINCLVGPDGVCISGLLGDGESPTFKIKRKQKKRGEKERKKFRVPKTGRRFDMSVDEEEFEDDEESMDGYEGDSQYPSLGDLGGKKGGKKNRLGGDDGSSTGSGKGGKKGGKKNRLGGDDGSSTGSGKGGKKGGKKNRLGGDDGSSTGSGKKKEDKKKNKLERFENYTPYVPNQSDVHSTYYHYNTNYQLLPN